MQERERTLSRTMAMRTGIHHAAVTVAAVLLTEVLAWALRVPWLQASASGRGAALPLGRLLLTLGLAALLGGGFGIWIGRGLHLRLARLVTSVEAWLRGNLALRIEDPAEDVLGVLAEDLDLLAEHLEEDEQDLARLRESNVRLTDQVRALAVVEERNRLARELHDSVKQHLFSLAMTASAVRTHLDMQTGTTHVANGELREMIHEIEVAAQSAQRETTRLIEDLRPAPLHARGLGAALNDYSLLFGAREHVLVYVDVDCEDQSLPPAISETLYRVAQEALHNVGRHAHATRVDVKLRCTPSRATLTIDDNGVGFDTTRARRGLGITNMHERLLNAGGRLVVESRPGTGTAITAEVDLVPGAPQSQPPAPAAGHALRHPTLPAATIRPPSNEIGPRGNRVQPDTEPWSEPTSPAPLVAVPSDVTSQPPDSAYPSPAESTEFPDEAARPSIEAWDWLGRKLVIPVGQQWPWPPAEQERYLRRPLVEEGLLLLKPVRGLMGLAKSHALWSHGARVPVLRIHREHSGHAWDHEGAHWTVLQWGGLRGRAVLSRNGQALAAMQYHGRQMDMWTEIIYDDRTYQLRYANDPSGGLILYDGGRQPVTEVLGSEVRLLQELPLPLVAMVMSRAIDETSIRRVTAQT